MSAPVRVRRGDLADAAAAAVVRPVRSDGEAITGAGRRLGVEAGPAVAERLAALGELPVGGAVITPAGALGGAEFMIHAVVQSVEEPVSVGTVERALANALRRARDLGLASLALPPLGAGAGQLGAEPAARLLLDALEAHLAAGGEPTRFEIVVESEYDEALYLRQVEARRPLAGRT